jgi:hypothetical protein
VITINLVLLTIMLAIWTDKLELEFNDLVRPIEFLKLIGISILGLIILASSVSFFRKYKINSMKKRIKISVILMLVTSLYFYVDYSIKIYTNRVSNSELRNGIMEKVSPIENGLGFGSKANNLNIKEYSEITKVNWFKKIPSIAENIDYRYSYEGFLPDYSFSISYDLPKESQVDTLNFVDGSFSKKQSFKVVGNKVRVTYYELQM